jgi:hypothetical protein
VNSNSEPCVSAPSNSASSVSRKVSVCELGPYASTLMLPSVGPSAHSSPPPPPPRRGLSRPHASPARPPRARRHRTTRPEAGRTDSHESPHRPPSPSTTPQLAAKPAPPLAAPLAGTAAAAVRVRVRDADADGASARALPSDAANRAPTPAAERDDGKRSCACAGRGGASNGVRSRAWLRPQPLPSDAAAAAGCAHAQCLQRAGPGAVVLDSASNPPPFCPFFFFNFFSSFPPLFFLFSLRCWEWNPGPCTR